MKKNLAAAVFVTALFAAQNANEQMQKFKIVRKQTVKDMKKKLLLIAICSLLCNVGWAQWTYTRTATYTGGGNEITCGIESALVEQVISPVSTSFPSREKCEAERARAENYWNSQLRCYRVTCAPCTGGAESSSQAGGMNINGTSQGGTFYENNPFAPMQEAVLQKQLQNEVLFGENSAGFLVTRSKDFNNSYTKIVSINGKQILAKDAPDFKGGRAGEIGGFTIKPNGGKARQSLANSQRGIFGSGGDRVVSDNKVINTQEMSPKQIMDKAVEALNNNNNEEAAAWAWAVFDGNNIIEQFRERVSPEQWKNLLNAMSNSFDIESFKDKALEVLKNPTAELEKKVLNDISKFRTFHNAVSTLVSDKTPDKEKSDLSNAKMYVRVIEDGIKNAVNPPSKNETCTPCENAKTILNNLNPDLFKIPQDETDNKQQQSN
ncbi:MAG: hypothetical protein LBC98_06860 [Prevotellaceae bacterium]|jgi:hypothetical protein|nr:hypothetical protein [Prevotellaceae bacterium]